MLVLLGFAFLAGLVTILAPCIWPILPIVLSSSIAGEGHRKPLGITLGIMLSFAFFTLAISYLVKAFHFDPDFLRFVAIIIIGILGLSMVIPALSRFVEGLISRISGLLGQGSRQGSGFVAGFIAGMSLGVVWSPCAGPILAAIAALAATGKVTISVVLVTLAYVAGVGIPLFIFAYGGRQVVTRTRFLSRYTGRIQQLFGIVMILTAVGIYTNYDRLIETKLLNEFPQIGAALNQFESSKTVSDQLDLLKGNKSANDDPASAAPVRSTENASYFNANTPAPDFVGITGWLNTDSPLSIKDLKGKVVLVDFWTYTCINCIRTLPHVISWYDKYKDRGFVVVGVHTPEFQFEHNTNNVQDAIKMYNIHYPVAQDNDYSTWNNYNNEYWPAEYLVDASGNIRRTHFGEGQYDEMEMAIRTLLKENGQPISETTDDLPDQTPTGVQSPETYLGAGRMEYYYDGGNTGTVDKKFTLADNLRRDSFSFGGNWNVEKEFAVAGKDAVLDYDFFADKVFLVLRPGNAGSMARVKVLLDGRPVDDSNAGADTNDGEVTVDADRLYNLINLRGKAGHHVLHLRFETPGIEAFAFTFG
ncbi:MAG TPA: cytochrome c biogenesis protein DipZ [Candidatus Acidoferrales bacterium]|nr:cytochrome c biogenesis protein DipZ [Candidatus Acidoferrales bacterium]